MLVMTAHRIITVVPHTRTRRNTPMCTCNQVHTSAYILPTNKHFVSQVFEVQDKVLQISEAYAPVFGGT